MRGAAAQGLRAIFGMHTTLTVRQTVEVAAFPCPMSAIIGSLRTAVIGSAIDIKVRFRMRCHPGVCGLPIG
jgi:hypothetical protein